MYIQNVHYTLRDISRDDLHFLQFIHILLHHSRLHWHTSSIQMELKSHNGGILRLIKVRPLIKQKVINSYTDNLRFNRLYNCLEKLDEGWEMSNFAPLHVYSLTKIGTPINYTPLESWWKMQVNRSGKKFLHPPGGGWRRKMFFFWKFWKNNIFLHQVDV